MSEDTKIITVQEAVNRLSARYERLAKQLSDTLGIAGDNQNRIIKLEAENEALRMPPDRQKRE